MEGHSDGSAYNTCFDSTHLGNSIVIFPGRDICQTITFSLIPSSHGKATGRKSPWQARTSVCARAQTATRRQARCSARHARSREWPASSAATTASSATGYVSFARPLQQRAQRLTHHRVNTRRFTSQRVTLSAPYLLPKSFLNLTQQPAPTTPSLPSNTLATSDPSTLCHQSARCLNTSRAPTTPKMVSPVPSRSLLAATRSPSSTRPSKKACARSAG